MSRLTFVSGLMIIALSSGLTGPDLFYRLFQRRDRTDRIKTT